MLKLYDKTFSTLYGTLSTVTEALVEEERNGLFELSFVMLNTDSLFSYIEKENIVVCNANDTLLNQKFRIYNTRKLMNNKVEVYARHISFDLMYDYIESLTFENQSCEYALNQLFRLSNFSQHYKGYSDIVNAQNYNVSECNVLEAIGGIKGSILDTFGTGAEILRDNENIHVLNKRGHDNSVTIEYRKNLTGFELGEDTTDLVTRILPYARYTPEGEEETIIKASYVDSPLINNYSHPFIKSIDYTDKFENDEVPTIERLIQFAQLEYTVNKVDIPKQNFKIEFIPLSKTVGYEALNDKISLCDTVTIKDTRYNVNTQSKVIKTVFNVLKNRYESIELGEPRTSLGDIISSSTNDKVTEEQVKDIVSSTPSTNYPNTLPAIPTLESFVYGFANIELRWTFENKVYYAYEVYASKTKGFTPNTFDLIYQGQASSYMFQAQPNETWYFKVCGINSYNRRTQFSNEVEVVTTKISDLSNYVDNMAIGEALIGELNLGRGWVGQLNANLLDVKGNFSVTDGNGKRTFDIDSFGNVHIDGYATFTNLATPGATTIDGRNITTGFINAIQLIAPHITGKSRMYLEEGSIFSSDGEANFKRFYGMPGGTFNVESEATFGGVVHAPRFACNGNYVPYSESGYKWVIESLQGIETENGDAIEFQMVGGSKFGVDIWYIGQSTISTYNLLENTSILENMNDGIGTINQLKHIDKNLTTYSLQENSTCLTYADDSVPNAFTYEIDQENGELIRQISPRLIIPHITLAIQQQQEQINLLNQQVKELKEEIRLLKEGV